MTPNTLEAAPKSAPQQDLATQRKGIECAFQRATERAISKDKKQFSFLEEVLR